MPDGKFVSKKQIRASVDKTVEILRLDMRGLGKQLAMNKITLPEFQIQMRDKLKTAHSLTASIGRGGRKQMTNSDWATVGNNLKKQYGYLNKFALGLENGTISTASIESRAAAYAMSIREPFYKQQTKAEKLSGRTKCRRVLHAKESCSECASWAGRGFVEIDEQPDIGELICGNFCRCEIEYQT